MVLIPQAPEEVPLSDDRVLVTQSMQGDSAAFSQLLRRHDDKMRGVVWRLVRPRDVMDDILQDAYLKAWRGLGNFRGDAAFSSSLVESATRQQLPSSS
jgi:RNA polymerase sigma-70 factor (ECF subfamily)